MLMWLLLIAAVSPSIAATNAPLGKSLSTLPLLPAPLAGTAENLFDNTADGQVIGFRGPRGDPPRMSFRAARQKVTYQCRTAPVSVINLQPFAPCDGEKGNRAFHIPKFQKEGRYRTEVRYIDSSNMSQVSVFEYYVHHSLDEVASCQSIRTDHDWLRVARKYISGADAFDNRTQLNNPFIRIVGRDGNKDYTLNVMSLRRVFHMSEDRKLIVVRRKLASRRTFQKTGRNVCNGVTVHIPETEIKANDRKVCSLRWKREQEFAGGLGPSKCPGVYCTITSCQELTNGCVQVIHTFNRGEGQKPWVVKMPVKCPDSPPRRYTNFRCDAYVFNQRGQSVCLVDTGSIRAIKTVLSTRHPFGLQLLRSGYDGHYTFSAKSKSPRLLLARNKNPKLLPNVLYLPE